MQKSKLPHSINFASLGILIFSFYILAAPLARASETDGTIVTGGNAGYAWSNRVGWVNFGLANGNIHVTDSAITGYAWSSTHGWINMAPTNGGITAAANGTLSGYAWGSSLGWINFSGASINSSGKFTGTASGSIVGSLNFDCTNCDVRTDFRPSSFRTVGSVAGATTVGGGGGSGGGGAFALSPDGQPIPLNVDSSNTPLKIYPAQYGTLIQDLSGGRAAKIEVPTGTFSSQTTIEISEQSVNASIAVPNVSVVGGALFNITARDGSNNLVKNLLRPITITLIIPEQLQNRPDLGVYYFDNIQNLWILVPNVVFSQNKAIFSVDHLTLFGIFSLSLESSGAQTLPPSGVAVLPPILRIFPSAPTPAPGETIPGKEEAPKFIFDIRLLLDRDKVARIADLVARVEFTSFGREPTPVDMTFSIIDLSGKELWKSTDSTTVQTQALFVKRFINAQQLAPGAYTLKLHTKYNNTVEDDFQAAFTVVSQISPSYWVAYLIGGLVLAIVFLWLWLKRRKKDHENI